MMTLTPRRTKRPQRPPASDLEQKARAAWQKWGDGFALFTTCDGCGEIRNCRGKRRARMLCLDCWDGGLS